jgi:glycerol-3-phosphate dehydrogenase
MGRFKMIDRNSPKGASDDPSTKFDDPPVSGHYDVLVIGGGIVGAGVARDAAMRGLKVALVEKSDFASGTSGRSSRLLHGGLRYLAQGRVGLVREASAEKRVLQRIAPHLANPLAFVFPTYQQSAPSRWKLWLGVKIYDLLCSGKNLGRSKMLNREGLLRCLPGIGPDGLTGGVRYFDGFTNDARLVIDTLRSARRHGAVVENYVEFCKATQVDDHWRCHLRDLQTGNDRQVTTQSVVNATGPWSDQLVHSGTSLRLTKGIHLVVDRDLLNVQDAVVMVDGERIMFVIPWGDRAILGTTDTDYDGPLSSPRCDESDVSQVLEAVNNAFPGANIRTENVLGTWTGLRPLVADKNGAPSDISRRHEIVQGTKGWWDITGGKLTTYRLMAEELVDQMVLGKTTPTRTHQEELLHADAAKFSGTLPPTVSQPAVAHFCNNEWAVHLVDIMFQRTSWRYYVADHQEVAVQVADWMASCLGWSDERKEQEIDDYQKAAFLTNVESCLNAGNAKVVV